MSKRVLLAAALVLTLQACFGGAGVPDQLFTLTATETRPAATPRSAPAGAAITVVDPSVPQALRTLRVPVYVSDTSVQYLTDAQWVENPAPLFARLVGETIAVKTGRVVLDSRQYTHDPGTRLTGQLQLFGVDPTAMEVVLVYDAAMAQPGGGIVTNRFEARVPITEASAAAVAPAMNLAANQVADQVATWIGTPAS